MAASTTISSLFFRVSSAHRPNPNGGNSNKNYNFLGNSKSTSLSLSSSRFRFSSPVAFARRKKTGSSTPKSEPSSKFKKTPSSGQGEEDDIDEDAIEALFSQLEEDLKKDGLSDDEGDDEITEEDMARLEQELAEAFGDIDLDELEGAMTEEDGIDDEESDEEEIRPQLKNWQIRRLAHALKVGRRKTSIKSLAAELGLDRAFVLELLRDPPPQLLLISASLPDEVAKPKPETETVESLPVVSEELAESILDDNVTETILDDSVSENKSKAKEPVHVTQTRWAKQKRIKKVHLETLERVYSRTKRPTNAMISSIVHLTNLPFKRVVGWFEEKRTEDGIPDQRVPYRRSKPKTVSTT